MPLSPVIEAFLGGQQQQSNILSNIQDILDKRKSQALRQQELQDTMSRFQASHDLALKQYDLEHEQSILESKQKRAAIAKLGLDAQHQIQQEMFEGSRPRPTEGTGLPIMNGMNFSTTPDTRIAQEMPYFNPITEENVNIPVPQLTKADLEARQTETNEGIKSKYNMKEIAANNAARVAMLESKIDSANQIAANHNATTLQVQEAKNEAAIAKGQLEMTKWLQNMGLSTGILDPVERQKTVNNLKTQFKTGQLDPVNTNPLHREALNQMATEDSVKVPVKIGQAINSKASSANRLINDYNIINKQYPANPQWGTRQIDRVVGALGTATDMGQAFKLINSDIAPLATLTGETASMARSVALAKKAEAAKISIADSPEYRQRKLVRLTDLAIDSIDAEISYLPKGQRIEIWKDLMSNQPLFQNLKRDIKYKDALINILQTGSYNSNLLNAAK